MNALGIGNPEKQEDRAEIPICGFEAYNDQDGETYTCGLDAHGPKVKHGRWIKI